jgi:hypothetical protein
MTISAQISDRPQADSGVAERATHRIANRHASVTEGAQRPAVVDCFALLDHRTRERCIPRTGAPSGRYLSVEHDGDTLLFGLERPITHIGRGLIADVRIEDPQVSRRHAIIALRGDGARVLDGRSSNGTILNGRAVDASYLTDGDVLRFGRVVLRFVEIAPQRRPEPQRWMAMARRVRRGLAESAREPYTARVSQ